MDISDGRIAKQVDIAVSPIAKKKEPGKGRETRPRQLGLPGRTADGGNGVGGLAPIERLHAGTNVPTLRPARALEPCDLPAPHGAQVGTPESVTFEPVGLAVWRALKASAAARRSR